MEKEIRILAIERYLKGESPKSIYTELGCSKYWFFKWFKRYQTGDKNWYKDKSKAPRTSPTAISKIDKQRIIAETFA